MSSRLVYDNQKNKYFIYSKGALNKINDILIKHHNDEANRLENIISAYAPELRLLACAWKEINYDDIKSLISGKLDDSAHRNLIIKNLETNLQFLGIIGIRDNLQIGVKNTIDNYKQCGITCSMCTGDRKITALAIAKEIGIIDINNIHDFSEDNVNEYIPNISNKTLIFDGRLDLNYEYLARCKNFIGYNMMPNQKKKITNIIEKFGIRTLTIGDGFNDIGMFGVSSISVAIKGNNFVEHSTDISIKNFNNLSKLLYISTNSYNRNSNLINITFYRCTMIAFATATFALLKYNDTHIALFNGLVLPAFNYAWCIPGLAYFTLISPPVIKYNNREYYKQKALVKTNYSYTSLWNIEGMLEGILIVLISYWLFGNSLYYNDLVGLIIICILNIRLLFINKITLTGIAFSLVGVGNFILYMMYNGSFFGIIRSLL